MPTQTPLPGGSCHPPALLIDGDRKGTKTGPLPHRENSSLRQCKPHHSQLRPHPSLVNPSLTLFPHLLLLSALPPKSRTQESLPQGPLPGNTDPHHCPKLMSGLYILLFYFEGRTTLQGMWDLSSPTWIEPSPSAVEVWSPHHWTTREILRSLSILK